MANYKSPIDKIEFNILGIYRNKRVDLAIADLRQWFKIPKNLYEKNKARFTTNNSLNDILKQLFDSWVETIPEEGEKIEKMCEKMPKFFKDYRVYKIDEEKINRTNATKKNYIIYLLKEFYDGKSLVYYLLRRSAVWKNVINASLFGLPLEVTLSHKESILPDFLPKINDDLTIKIHEATDIRDFKFIEQEVKAKQMAYKNKYKLQINLDKNKLYARNLRAYELRRIEKNSYKDTRLALKKDFPKLISEESEDSDINKMVKSHLKYADDVWYP